MNGKVPRQNFRLRITGGNVLKEEVENHLEDELSEWVNECRSSGLPVSRAIILHNAQAFHEQKCNAGQVSPSFIASTDWVQKFVVRNGLSVRHRTTELQKDQNRRVNKLNAYQYNLSYKYDDSKTGIPTVMVTLLPWTKQLSGKICCPALLLTTRNKYQFD